MISSEKAEFIHCEKISEIFVSLQQTHG